MMNEYTIECHDCAAGDPAHRSECLVALLDDLEESPGEQIVFDETEIRALRALQDGGLIPSAAKLPEVNEGVRYLRETGS